MPARLKSLIPSSIRHKLILAAITCIVVPAIVSLILYNSLTKEALRREAVSNASDALQLVRGSVTNLLLSKINIANYIQMNSGLNSYFKQVVSGNEDPDPYRRFMDSNRVLEHLDSLTVVGEKSYVTVILENGSYYMNYSVSDYNPLDYRRWPWFSRISSRKAWSLYGRSRRPRCSSPTKSIIRRGYRWCARSGRRIPRYTAT